mgnify:FL=1
MADMLVELIESFIGGSEATLNSLFKSMVNLVFHIERELSNLKLADGSFINFNKIYETIFSFAIYILIIVFISKAIKIYFMMREGDEEENPIQLMIGMIKAVIIMICFKEIYNIFVGIVQEFLNGILSNMTVQGTNLAEILTGNMGGGIFTAVACLVLLIVWLILICQFIMKGIEILVMRLGIPFASIGLLNSDNGVFTEYVRDFLLTAFTLVVQLGLLNLSILALVNGHLIYGIAIAIVSVNTPMMLGKFMIRPNGSLINSMGNTARSIRALMPHWRRR